MAKVFNNMTKTGKVAGSVFSVRNGVVIERAYNPIVANPSTKKQVEARAKLKLISQLAAVMAPVVAFTREGLVSPRNQFVKRNYPSVTYSNQQAQVDFSAIQITKSVIGLPGISATRESGNISLSLGVGTTALSRMVYTVFAKNPDNTIRYVGSVIATQAGEGNLWPAQLSTAGAGGSVTFIVYGYGVRDLTDAATAIYGDMQAVTAEAFAKLIVTRTLTEADVQLTESRYTEVATA